MVEFLSEAQRFGLPRYTMQKILRLHAGCKHLSRHMLSRGRNRIEIGGDKKGWGNRILQFDGFCNFAFQL
ncbi:hypothetical protein L6164_007459 [Bauhinia variegata]|uniref:Uncharacterized protein n=1 Tax=Bauhinia variegata TaxID=167791 RepID=A0ACB9PCN4_BAUVA|nr:hypothetical protein L6164_007459 [Bauhinia variegata]